MFDDYREAEARARLTIDPADIDWGPPLERSDEWPDDPDTRRFTEWLRSLLPAEEWERRRLAHFFALYGAGMPVDRERTPDLPFNLEAGEDRGGWYLFLAESWIDHISDYEPAQGSRIIPLFQMLGANFDLLMEVEGVEARARRILVGDAKAPDGALFELLVALAYKRAGWSTVRFVEERRDQKTPDLIIMNGEQVWAVECKRMSKARYSQIERDLLWRLWRPVMSMVEQRRFSLYFDLTFKSEVSEVPEDYLVRLAGHALEAGGQMEVNDAFAAGRVSPIDISAVQAEVRERPVLHPSQRLFELLTGEYAPTFAYAAAMEMKAWSVNPRYIDDLSVASIIRWRSIHENAINAKARHFKRQMAEATRQLRGWGPAVLHLGHEAMEGQPAEAARRERLNAVIRDFNTQGVWLFWIMIHHFSFESPPDAAWVAEETVDWHGTDRAPSPLPLPPRLLQLPNDEPGQPPWEGSERPPPPSV